MTNKPENFEAVTELAKQIFGITIMDIDSLIQLLTKYVSDNSNITDNIVVNLNNNNAHAPLSYEELIEQVEAENQELKRQETKRLRKLYTVVSGKVGMRAFLMEKTLSAFNFETKELKANQNIMTTCPI